MIAREGGYRTTSRPLFGECCRRRRFVRLVWGYKALVFRAVTRADVIVVGVGVDVVTDTWEKNRRRRMCFLVSVLRWEREKLKGWGEETAVTYRSFT